MALPDNRGKVSRLLLTLLFLLAARPAAAQAWERVSPPLQPSTREGAVLVYDRVHQHLVLFGGYRSDPMADTWTLTGDVWNECAPANPPPPRHDAYGFWDDTRERVVVFGGTGYGTDRNEIWSWDGTDWSSTMPANLVTPERRDAAVAYDSDRDRIVLFGGTVDGSPDVSMADTWEYDGTGWTEIEPDSSPPDRSHARMGYDPVRKIVVLMGGSSQIDGSREDTWIWDGSNWTERTDADTPVTSSQLRMTWDTVEQKLMLAGTEDVTSLRAWHFDGTRWIAHAESGLDVYGINAPCLAFDESRGHAVYFTSENNANIGFSVSPAGDWSKLLPVRQPGGIDVDRGGFVYDSGQDEFRLFGGSLGDDPFSGWGWDGDMWRLLELQDGDVVSSPCCIAYDATRNTTVVLSNRTVELVGDTWTPRTTSVYPPSGGGMAYHAGRGRVIYFGGTSGYNEFHDKTWEWDGSDWSEITTGTSPPARRNGAMAYDAARDRLVLFGGMGLVSGQARYIFDTWEFVGDDWHEVDVTGPTTFRGTPTMTYDANRQRVFMWAESDIEDARVWEFNGTSWIGTNPPPQQGDEGLLGYDSVTNRLVLHLADGTTWVRESGTVPQHDGGIDGDTDGGDGGAGTDDGIGTDSGCGCSTRDLVPPAWIALLALLVSTGLARRRPVF